MQICSEVCPEREGSHRRIDSSHGSRLEDTSTGNPEQQAMFDRWAAASSCAHPSDLETPPLGVGVWEPSALQVQRGQGWALYSTCSKLGSRMAPAGRGGRGKELALHGAKVERH